MAGVTHLAGLMRSAVRRAQQGAASFRAADRKTRVKTGLVALYAVVVVLTLVLTPPTRPAWRVRVTHIPFGLSFKTAVDVTRERHGDLEEVTLVVTGESHEFRGRVAGWWSTQPLTLREGEKHTLFTEALFDPQGSQPSYALELTTLHVVDAKGRTVADLTPLLSPEER